MQVGYTIFNNHRNSDFSLGKNQMLYKNPIFRYIFILFVLLINTDNGFNLIMKNKKLLTKIIFEAN